MQGDPAHDCHDRRQGKDTVGSQELNEKLSQRRAQAVFEALVYTNKVPENRVELKWTERAAADGIDRRRRGAEDEPGRRDFRPLI